MFSCFNFNQQQDNEEKKPLIQKEPQTMKVEAMISNTVNINEPILNLNIIEKIYENQKINNWKTFLIKYTLFLIENSSKLKLKQEKVLNMLNVFRLFYKIILYNKYVPLKTLKLIQDKYIHCCERYRIINDENIFPKEFLLEMEQILIQIQKLPFGNN